jgi:hypothetical protein
MAVELDFSTKPPGAWAKAGTASRAQRTIRRRMEEREERVVLAMAELH